MKYSTYFSRSLKLLPILSMIIFMPTGCDILNLDPTPTGTDYREEMRQFVIDISTWADSADSDFIVIPQNGEELLVKYTDTGTSTASFYINAIDGQAREDLFYGYSADDELTPISIREEMMSSLDLALDYGLEVLVTDYVYTQTRMNNSYLQNYLSGYLSFAAPRRDLDVVPDYPAYPYNWNTYDINDLQDAYNFLYLINPQQFSTTAGFVETLDNTWYDCLIIDRIGPDDEPLDVADIHALQTKPNDTRRRVVAYMSIGEAEDYRDYWNPDWEADPPDWLAEENPNWPGNYKVRYWMPEWQNLIFGSDTSYLGKIQSQEFDGVYLDIIDAYEYFEAQ